MTLTLRTGTVEVGVAADTAWIPVLTGGRVLRRGDRLVTVEPDALSALAFGGTTMAAPGGSVTLRAVLCGCDPPAGLPADVEVVDLPRRRSDLVDGDRRAAMWAAAQWMWLDDADTARGEPTTGFPRIDPCVMVLVRAGDRVVLLHRHGAPASIWSAVAGYVEPGESAEEAVAREVAEETGLTVSAVRYIASESWPPSGSVMFGFIATVVEPPDTPLCLDAAEHDAGMWFSRVEIAAAADSGVVTTACGVELSLRNVRGLGAQIVETFLEGR